jgi:hypothetical protein
MASDDDVMICFGSLASRLLAPPAKGAARRREAEREPRESG